MTNYLTPDEATEKLPRFNADWFRQQLRKGALRGSKVGGRWLIDESAIDEMVEAGSNSTRRRRQRVVTR
jgi:hypothetical protein